MKTSTMKTTLAIACISVMSAQYCMAQPENSADKTITTTVILTNKNDEDQQQNTSDKEDLSITITDDRDANEITDGKDGKDGKDGNEGTRIVISSSGVAVNNSKAFEKKVGFQYLMLDLGVNALNDRTDYQSTAVKEYLQTPAEQQNANLYSLRMSKSINVNIWPVIVKFNLASTASQKVYFYSGAGMQFYNFRFNKNISHLSEPNPQVIGDSVSFSKNKLSFAYASIPLMFNFQTKLAGKTWLVYGVGAIGGYAFDIWTKQISNERGKQKNHDQFNFNRFNLNLCAEIGIKNILRFYGTYQVTNLYKNTMTQNPYCIGLRLFGV
jgi:hypothetical protein